MAGDVVSRDDILKAQSHTWNHIFGFVRSMSLKCAIELQIPDIIDSHGAPMLLSELVETLPINKNRSHSVYRLMRILVHSGFFVKQSMPATESGIYDLEKEGYLLAPAFRLLLKDGPFGMKPFLLAMLDPIFLDPWQHLSKWFQDDDHVVSAFQIAHGSSLWDFTTQEPKLQKHINEATASDARLISSIITTQCAGVFQGLHSIVDVGGGTGTLAKAIADAYPDINCISFDLPYVVNGLEGSKNLSYVSGDMFEAIPKADAVILKWILHDWSDGECIKILKQCKDAIPSRENGGKLIIIDIVVEVHEEDYESLETQLFFDMLLMGYLTGKERTEEEWAILFRAAGISDYKITTKIGLRSVIEAYP